MPNKIKSNRAFIFRLDAHYRLFIAFAFGVAAYFLFGSMASVAAKALSVWIVFAFTVIALDWITILWAHPLEIHKIAKLQDSNRTLIFLFVIVGALVSLAAIIMLLVTTKKHSSPGAISENILLTLSSVAVSWWLVHTVFAMRYARMYYTPDADDGKPGGLQFPDEPEPDYLDFVYFSFVIGMTFQVSDVEIASRQMRRLAWVHGLISFIFNTAIVALSINVISGLVSS